MGGSACAAAFLTPESVIAFIGAVGAVVAALTALGVQVARNVKDIQAAWKQIRLHETVLNGAVEVARKSAVK